MHLSRNALVQVLAGHAAALILCASPATAQFRENQPAVMAPPPPPPNAGQATAASFRGAYAKAGKPRMMIFWNREFTDEVATVYEDRITEKSVNRDHTMDTHDASKSSAGANRTDESLRESSSRRDLTVGTDRLTNNLRASSLVEEADWAIEGALNQSLIAQGAILTDRDVAMRTSRGAARANSHTNMQALETQGVAGRADLLVEIKQTSSIRSPMGVAFRVTVKNIRNARVLAAFSTRARPPAAPSRFVAGRYGYERSQPNRMTPDQVGHQLADEIMGNLTVALNQLVNRGRN